MKIFFICIVFAIAVPVLAQPKQKAMREALEDNTAAYYKLIYTAEKFLMQDLSDSALKYYTDARKVFGLYQLNDRRNVMICLNNCSDTSILREWFRYGYYCAADSIGPENYMKLYHSFIPESLSSNLLETLQHTPKMKWTYIEEYEQISQILDPLYEIDQKYRSKEYANSNDKSILLKRKKADNKNFSILMSCYKRYGDFSTNRFSSKFKDSKSAYNLILVHYFFNKENMVKHHDFFVGQVKKGNLDSRIYAQIVDNYLSDTSQVYGCHTSFCYNDTVVVYELSEPYKSRINRNRSQIFLQDIETLHQKQVWSWQNHSSYTFDTLWDAIPEKSSDTVRDLAEEYKALMGPMVVGYTIYTR